MSEENNANTLPDDATVTDEVRELPLRNLNIKQMIELDACTRCGECLTWCPVYDQDAREAVIPRRKIIDFLKIARAQHGLLARIMRHEKISEPLKNMIGRIFGYRHVGKAEIEDFVQNLYECSTCGQCEVVCPAHIETVSLWEELRRIIVQAGYGPLEAQKALVKSVKAFDNPWQQPRAGRTKWARKALKDGLIRQLPREIKKTRAKVLLFFGCTASYDVNVRQVAINNINILEALGIDYGILGAEEKCCASVLLRMGDPEHHRVFKENIDIFNSLGIDTLISSCSGCFKTIMQDYPRIAPLNFEVLHSVEFFARLLKKGKLKFPHPVNRTVTYHDPCHLGRATGGFDAPRMIMEAIPGLKLIEMPRNREYSRCCGAGGGLKAGFPDIQNKMARRRIREAEETGAEALVSSCPFCFQGLNIGISALESPLVMRDISALVAESLLGYDVFQQPVASGAEAPGEETEVPDAPAPRVAEALPDETGEAPSDERAAIKAEREKKRAARRTEPSPDVPEGIAPVPEEVKAAEVIPHPPGEEKEAEAPARDAKKAVKRSVLVLLLAALLLAGPAVPPIGAAEPAIRMAVLQSDIHQLAFWVAMEKGFFTKNGVSVEVAGVFKAGPEIMTAFAAGELDMAYVGEAPATTAVANKAANVVVVAQVNTEGSALVVAKENTAIKSLADLKGKTVAVPGHSTVQDFLLRKAIKNAGVDPTSVNIIVVKPPEMISALRTAQIDAFIAWEPHPSKAATMGVGQNLATSAVMWPGHPCCVLATDKGFLAKQPEKVRAVVAAHVQATDYIHHNAEEAIAIGVKSTGMDEATVRKAMGNVHFTCELNVDGEKEYVRFLSELGLIRIENPDAFVEQFLHPAILRDILHK